MSQVSGQRLKHSTAVVFMLAIILSGCGGGGGFKRVDTGNSSPGGVANKGSNSNTPLPHSLAIQVSPASSGTVISSPAGINCAASCNANFVSGTVVTLTIAPSQNFAFTGWSGACSGSGACSVTLNADTTVAANFAAPPPMQSTLSITASGAGSGTVSSNPAGIACGSTCSSSFNSGTQVTLTASPATGSAFAGWSGAVCAGTGTCTVAVNTDTAVTAIFVPVFTLTTNTAGTGSGSITSVPAGINCGASCSSTFSAGTMVSLAAAPASGSSFTGWSGACTGTGSCNVTLNSSQNVTANFGPSAPQPQYTLTVTTTGSGSVTSSPTGINCGSSCSAAYNSGTSVTLTPTPASGSAFLGWNSAFCAGTSPCTIVLNSDEAIAANFVQLNSLTVNLAGSGTGTVSSVPAGVNCGTACSAQYGAGTMVSLAATPSTGSVFTSWGGSCSGSGSCSVAMNSAQTVSAQFDPQPLPQYALTVSPSGNGTGTISSTPPGIDCGATCVFNFAGGTSVTLTANPASGSGFLGWVSSACTGIDPCTLTVNSPQSVGANFGLLQPLTVTVGGLGSGAVTSTPAGINCEPQCAFNFFQNSTVTLTAVPATGSVLSSWTGACSGTGACSINMSAPEAVEADFDIDQSKTQAAPILTVAPSPYDFGTVQTGTTLTRNLQISNTGPSSGGNLNITAASVDNGLFGVPSTQFPMSIAPGTSAPLTVTFTPQALGSTSGTISFISNGSNPNTTETLNGTGGITTSSGALSISPTTLYFGNVVLGETQNETIVMSNPGSGTTTVFSGTVTGSGFSIVSPTFPVTLSQNTAQVVTISFTPASSGPATAVVSFTSDAVQSPQLSLVASGNASSPVISALVFPTSLDFGFVPVGSIYIQTVVVYNTGNTSLQVNGASATGTGYAIDSSQYPVTIAANSAQQFNIIFSASSIGSSPGSVTFSTNASNGNPQVALNGTGVVASSHTAKLTWNASGSGKTVAGYNVYRSTTSGSGYQRLAFTNQLTFTDATVVSGTTYYYVVTAVTAYGTESSYSTEAAASIP